MYDRLLIRSANPIFVLEIKYFIGRPIINSVCSMGAPSEKLIQFADQIRLHDLDIQIQFADRIPDIKIISQSVNWIQFVWCFSFKIKEHLRTVCYFLFYRRVKRMAPLCFEGNFSVEIFGKISCTGRKLSQSYCVKHLLQQESSQQNLFRSTWTQGKHSHDPGSLVSTE